MSPDAVDRDDLIAEVLREVRAFGDAHDHMAHELRAEMNMNATDVAALRLLIMHEDHRVPVTAAALARHLRISTASTTKLLDRLSASGHLTRRPHPADRRAVTIELTDFARTEFFRLFQRKLAAMRASMTSFTDEELQTVAQMLNRLSISMVEE